MRRNYVRRILCLLSRVAHSLVWILPDCHGIVALPVISGKQPSSELLHTLQFICVCWPPKRQCSISTAFSPQHGSTSCLPGNFLARVTMSTNVDDTASSHRARISHNIHNSGSVWNLCVTARKDWSKCSSKTDVCACGGTTTAAIQQRTTLLVKARCLDLFTSLPFYNKLILIYLR